MSVKKWLWLFLPLLFFLLISKEPFITPIEAAGHQSEIPSLYAPDNRIFYQGSSTSRCRVDACTGACTMETLFWGSQTTFDTYLDVITPLTGCDQNELKAALGAAFDVASELASVETGAFLSCGNVWAGVEHNCEVACQANPCRYAPNLRVSAADPAGGSSVLVSLNNGVSGDGLDGSAISGGIDLNVSIRYDGWDDFIPFAAYQLPSLGYPGLGWATNAAAACTDDSARCEFLRILANAGTGTEVAVPLSQGGVYNLESLIMSSSGIDSELNSGYASLLNGDDTLTLAPGLSGSTFVREDFDWNGTWDNQYVELWNSSAAEYTVSNTECHYFCWFGRQKVNRDKFVLVFDGPCDSLLLGDYSLKVDAPLDHDRNIENNQQEIDYSVDSVPLGCATQSDSALLEETLSEGVHHLSFAQEPIKYYKVIVPDDASLLEVILQGPNSDDPNDNLDLLLRRGSVPETTRQGFVAYDYLSDDLVGYPDRLRVQIPEPGEWFVEVYHRNLSYSGDFDLSLHIETSATPILDITEGHYSMNFARGQSSQVFFLAYLDRLENMKVSFTPPPSLGFFSNDAYTIYLCPQMIPQINYEHTAFPGFVCSAGGRIDFSGQGVLNQSRVANVSGIGSRPYYVLVEREQSSSSADYNLDIEFTWPAGVGDENEPNDSCDSATLWPAAELSMPKRGFFYQAGNNGDEDAYTIQLQGGGRAVEMETYLANVPADIAADMVVYKKNGSLYQELGADRSASQGGSPHVRFDMTYGEEYCVVVSSRNAVQNQQDSYSLYLREAGLSDTDEVEVEPNGYPDVHNEFATPWVNMDNAMRGRWTPIGDRDFFRWNAPRTGIYFLSVNSVPGVPTHYMLIYEQTGMDADMHRPILNELNQGHNLSETHPVGLTFYATRGMNYYFELFTDSAADSDWYRLNLQYLGDYRDTCSGAALLHLGGMSSTGGVFGNTLSSQLTAGDKDCFKLVTGPAGVYTFLLPRSPDNISPLVEIFSFNPFLYDFEREARVKLGEFTHDSGAAPDGEYELAFTRQDDSPGLAVRLPDPAPDVAYCACISDGISDDGSGQTGSGADTDMGNNQTSVQTEQEPNNLRSAANPWDEADSLMRGKLDDEGDIDIFLFTAWQSGIYSVRLEDVASNIEPKLLIYRSTGSSDVDHCTDAGPGESAQVQIDANQGESFYVRVNASSRFEISDQEYSLFIDVLPDADEPNDTRSQPTLWNAFDQPVQGYFYEKVSGPADVYQFSIPPSAGSVLLTLNLTDVAADVKANLYLKNETNNAIANVTNAATGESISITVDANTGETYSVSISPDNRLQTSLSPYSLSLTMLTDADEPNDTISSPTSWDAFNGPIQGYFYEQLTGPADVYRFTVPQSAGSGPLTVLLSDVPPNIKANMAIYNASNIRVASEFQAEMGEAISLTFDVSPGETYYVSIHPQTRLQISTSPYTLSISPSNGQ